MTRPTIRRLLIGAAALLAVASCGGGGGGDALQPPIADLTGTWSVQDYVRGDCPGKTYPVTRSWTATVTQSGNTLAFLDTSTGRTYRGTISGSALSWSVSGPDGTGTTTGTFTGTASTDGNGVSGKVPWTWTDATSPTTCTGITLVTASRSGSSPAAPVIAAVAGFRQATVSWTASPGIVGYDIYRSTSPGAATSGTIAGRTGYGLAQLIDSWLTNGTTYYYAVKARDAAYQTSPASNEVAATPSPGSPRPATPTGVVATPGPGKVTVSCSPVAGATYHRVYRASVANTMTTYDALSGHLATWTSSCTGIPVTFLTPGTTYYFVVTAWNESGESEPSTEVSAVVPQ